MEISLDGLAAILHEESKCIGALLSIVDEEITPLTASTRKNRTETQREKKRLVEVILELEQERQRIRVGLNTVFEAPRTNREKSRVAALNAHFRRLRSNAQRLARLSQENNLRMQKSSNITESHAYGNQHKTVYRLCDRLTMMAW